MQHNKKLQRRPFDNIKSGNKTIEMRLYDEKRRKINVGDIIEFKALDADEKVCAEVIALNVYNTFDELYNSFEKTALGYYNEETADPKDMNKYYSNEDICKYGVVGIEIKVR